LTFTLVTATESDIDELMTWFHDAAAVDTWGGPAFRFPFDRQTFHADCRWTEYASYCLRDAAGAMAAFGQMTLRHGRTHLARLVVNPARRGQGVGRRLLEALIAIAAKDPAAAEIALFVYKDNAPAYGCYSALGFRTEDYPEGAALRDECYYMTRPLG